MKKNLKKKVKKDINFNLKNNAKTLVKQKPVLVSVFLFFLSVFRSLKNNLFQVVVLIIFVVIGSAIFTGFSEINSRLQTSYSKIMANAELENSLLEAPSSIVDNSTSLSYDAQPVSFAKSLQSVLEKKTNNPQALVTYVDTRNFFVNNFNKITSNNCYFKVISYQSSTYLLNKPLLVKGTLPTQANFITISPLFAAKQHLKLLDKVIIDNSPYIISGFTLAPDYIYPYFGNSNFLPSNKYNSVIYANHGGIFRLKRPEFTPSSFADRECYFSIKVPGWNNHQVTSEVNALLQENKNTTYKWTTFAGTSKHDTYANTFNNNFSVYDPNSSSYKFNLRLNFFPLTIRFNLIFSYVFLGIIMFIVLVLMMIIIWRLLQADAVLMGTFKAIGYSKRLLMFTYFSYPLIIGFSGVIIGWLLNFALQSIFLEVFNVFFSLPNSGLSFNIVYLIIAFAVAFILFTVIVMAITFHLLRTKVLQLLNY